MKFKKFILSLCILSSSAVVMFGQTEQWNILIGGKPKLDFGSAENGGNTIYFELSLQSGLFVIDGFVLGFELPVSIYSHKYEDGDKWDETTIAFAPFAKYYHGTKNIKPYIYGEIGLGKYRRIKKEGAYTDDYSASMFLYEIGSGLGIFLNEKVSLDVGLGYVFTSLKSELVTIDADLRSISSGIAAGIGFYIIL